MALNIGNVNFGVDAQTQGLQKAILQLNRFRSLVNQTARQQTQGAQQAAAALARQESAIKRAFQQTLNLQRALRQAGDAAVPHLGNTTRAFQTLTKEMTSGRLSVVEYTRSIDAFNARLNRASRALKDMQAAAKAKEVNRLTEIFRQLESSAVLAVGPLSGLGARLRSLGAIASRANLTLAAMLGTIVALSVGIATLGASAVRTSAELERINARFQASSGSAEMAQREFNFVARTARTMGLRIEDVAASYSRLHAASAGTSLEGERARQIFLGISSAAAALRLNTQEVEGIFRAVEQMISKGNVTAEELRGQLGERLPGAFQLAARAMGVTTKELDAMLKKGEVATEDFLPKFNALLLEVFGDAAKSNVNAFTGVMNNLHNATTEFNSTFDKTFGITDKVKGSIRALTAVIDFFERNLQLIADTIGAVAGGLVALSGPAILRGVASLGVLIANVAKSMAALNIATLATTGGVAALGRVALFLAGATAGIVAMEALMNDIDETMEDMVDTINTLNNTSTANLTDEFDKVWQILQETRQEIELLQQAQRESTSVVDILQFEGLIKAKEVLRDLNQDELDELGRRLGTLSTRANMENIFGNMFAALARHSQEVDRFKRALERTPEIMREVNQEFATMDERINALQRGPRAVELFEIKEQHVRAMEQMRDKLEQTSLTMEEQNGILERYDRLLRDLGKAQDTFSTASQDMAATLVNGFGEAIFAADDFKEAMRELEKEIIRVAMRSLVLKPFERALSGFLGNVFVGGPKETAPQGSVTVQMPGPPGYRKGAAFRRGVRRMSRGGILSGPTLFGTRHGLALGGEAGDEAVLPLTRTSSGNLGVEATGGGGVTINVYDMRSNKDAAPVEMRQSNSNGRRQLDIIIRDRVKAMMDSGELDKPLSRNFGIGRKGVR